ncbi:unnamed protein product [Orchesella dallaii]|uniref:Uncharacterized protein n=1 Tax=Orchesella dallaii TaxID=48710 RepID=A0ABP1Q7K9_9HEXA
MADLLLSNPLIVVGFLIGNALIISLLFYHCFRRWTNKRLRSNSAVIIPVTRYIIEAPSPRSDAAQSPEPRTSLGDILLIRQPFPLNRETDQPTFCVSHCQLEISDMDKAEAPPPQYDDIFPTEKKSSVVIEY